MTTAPPSDARRAWSGVGHGVRLRRVLDRLGAGPELTLPTELLVGGGLLFAGGALLFGAGTALLGAAGLAVLVWVAVVAPEFLIVAFLAAGPFNDAPVVESLGVDATAVAALGVVFAMAVALVRANGHRWSFPLATAAFVGLMAVAAVAAFYSPDRAAAVAKLARFETFSALAFFAPLVIVRSRESFLRLMIGLVALGCIASLAAVETGHDSHPLVLPGGSSEIEVGLLAGLGLAAIVGCLWSWTPSPVRVAWLVPAGLMLNTAVGAGSRGALVGVVAAVIVGLAIQLASRTPARTAAAGLFGLLIALAALAWQVSPPAAQEKFTRSLTASEGGLSFLNAGGGERREIWDSAVAIFQDHPLGVGLAGFSELSGFDWPHNIFLELGAELGVLGIGLFVALLAGVGVALTRRGRTPGGVLQASGAAALVTVPLILSLSSFDLNGNRMLWFALGTALAVGPVAQRRTQTEGRERAFHPPAQGATRVPFRPPPVASGGAEAFVFRCVEAALGVAMVIVTARLMEPSGRGLFALASLTAVLCSLPLGSVWNASAVELAHGRTSAREILGANLPIAFVGGTITALVALTLVPFLGDHWWVVAVPALATPAVLLSRYGEGLFQSIGHVRAVNWVTVGRMGLPLIAIGGALAAGAGDRGAIIAWTIGLAVLAPLVYVPLRRRVGPPQRPSQPDLDRRLLRVGFRLVLVNSSLLLSTRLALLALAAFASTALVGVYSVAIAVSELLYMTTIALESSAFHRIGSGDRLTAVSLTTRSIRHVIVLTCVGAAVTVPLTFLLLPSIVGPGYEQVPALVLALVPGVVAFAVWWAMHTFFVVRLDRSQVAARVAGVGIVLTAVLAFALVPVWGVWGAVVSSVAGNTVAAGLGLMRFRALAGVSVRDLLPGRAELDDYRALFTLVAGKLSGSGVRR